MRKFYLIGLIALACIIIGLAWADQVTLSTYYPAPYGVYREMQANLFYANPQSPATATGHPNVPAGEEANWEGKMYYNDGSGGTVAKGMYYYNGTSWLPLGGAGANVRAWINFNGETGTVNANFNASVTKTSDGYGTYYQINWTPPFADTNYMVTAICEGDAGGGRWACIRGGVRPLLLILSTYELERKAVMFGMLLL